MSYLDTDLASRLFPSLLMLKLIPIFMLWLLFVNKIYAIFRLSLEIEFKSREKFMIRARSLRCEISLYYSDEIFAIREFVLFIFLVSIEGFD